MISHKKELYGSVLYNEPCDSWFPSILLTLSLCYISKCWYLWQVNYINSLTSWRCGSSFKGIIFKLIIQNNGLGTNNEIAFVKITKNLTNEMSSLVQAVAWCHQATRHYLSQCWPRSMSPHDVAQPQWVNSIFTFVSFNSCGIQMIQFVMVLYIWHYVCDDDTTYDNT